MDMIFTYSFNYRGDVKMTVPGLIDRFELSVDAELWTDRCGRGALDDGETHELCGYDDETIELLEKIGLLSAFPVDGFELDSLDLPEDLDLDGAIRCWLGPCESFGTLEFLSKGQTAESFIEFIRQKVTDMYTAEMDDEEDENDYEEDNEEDEDDYEEDDEERE